MMVSSQFYRIVNDGSRRVVRRLKSQELDGCLVGLLGVIPRFRNLPEKAPDLLHRWHTEDRDIAREAVNAPLYFFVVIFQRQSGRQERLNCLSKLLGRFLPSRG
jgi:hypothetical protein